MGDRANIKVLDGKSAVFLYSHWGGEDMLDILHTALSRRQRWKDGPYLTRIIFCEMIKGQESEETGFGISTGLCDNEHAIVVVDPLNGVVSLQAEGGNRVHGPIPFNEFVENPAALVKAYREY